MLDNLKKCSKKDIDTCGAILCIQKKIGSTWKLIDID